MRVIAAILFALIWWLVLADLGRSGTSYHVELESQPSEPYVVRKGIVQLQSTASVQHTAPVQKTQSASALHELSVGADVLPIEMLRSGSLR